MAFHAADLTSVGRKYVRMIENGMHTIPHGASRGRSDICLQMSGLPREVPCGIVCTNTNGRKRTAHYTAWRLTLETWTLLEESTSCQNSVACSFIETNESPCRTKDPIG